MEKFQKARKFVCKMLSAFMLISTLACVSMPTASAESAAFADVPRANGTFIQAWLCMYWDDETWQTELQTMKDAGFEYLILGDVANKAKTSEGGKWSLKYPSTLPELSGDNLDVYYGDLLEVALRNCKTAGIKCFIGMGGYDDWWLTGGIGSGFTDFCSVSAKICEEVYNRYYNRYPGTFYGWYFVPEIYNNYLNITPYTSNLATGMNIVLNKLTELNDDLPFLMSPYYNEYYTSASLSSTKSFWSNLFSKVNFRSGDIFCPQDAVGAGWVNMSSLESITNMYKEVVDASNKGVKLWANCENFTQPQEGGLAAPPKTENTEFISATLDRFVTQMEIASRYCENIITFSYNHYYSPIRNNSVYNDTYVRYIKSGYLDNDKPVASQINTELQSDGSLKISWNEFYDNIGIAVYRVYKNGTLVCRNDLTGMTLTKEYIDTSFNATSATYEIEAIDGAGNVSDRAIVNVDGSDPNSYNDLSGNIQYKDIVNFEKVPTGIKPGIDDSLGYFDGPSANGGDDYLMQVEDNCGFAQSKGLKFSVKDSSTNDAWVSTRIYPSAFTANSAQGADSLTFWIDTTDMANDSAFSHQIYFYERDDDGDETTLWTLEGNQPVYLENGYGMYKKTVPSGSTITYPVGFKGMVKIPFSSLCTMWGTTDSNDKVGLDNIEYIMLGFNSLSYQAGSSVVFDNIGFSGNFTQADNYSTICDFSNVSVGTKPGINDINSCFTSSALNNNFDLEVTNKGVNSSNALTYSVPSTVTDSQWVSCKINDTAFNNTSASNSNMMRFWIDTTSLKSNNDFEHQLYFSETDGENNLTTVWGLKSNCNYYIEDHGRLRTMTADGSYLNYPTNYKGYVYVSLDNFETKFDTTAVSRPVLSNINYIQVSFNSFSYWKGSSVTFDDFSFGVSQNTAYGCFNK